MERIHRLNYDLDKMLFTIPAKMHGEHDIRRILEEHPEVKFVSFVGIDMGGHDTDEKIPTKVFLDDLTKLLAHGVQTCLLYTSGIVNRTSMTTIFLYTAIIYLLLNLIITLVAGKLETHFSRYDAKEEF